MRLGNTGDCGAVHRPVYCSVKGCCVAMYRLIFSNESLENAIGH